MTTSLTISDKELILAYVDGELSTEQKNKVRELLNTSEDAAQFAEKINFSEIPFAASFDPMLETRIPARTTQFIENFQNNEADSGNSRKASLVAIAASLLIGILVGVFAHSQLNVTEPEAQAPDWISQVANYQQLYIRPTVENAAPVNVEFLDKLFTDNLALEVKVPDLSNRSIEFMRGQLLEVNGNPLVQLAYLPAEGKPLAICIMRGQQAAGTPTSTIDQFGKSHGLTYGSWSQHGLNFVLVADMPIGDVKELVSQTRQQLESS